MSQDLVIWVVVLWFVVFLVLGQHVATVLFASGLLGIALWVGPQVFDGIIGTNVFFTASTYSLSIIPLYLLMAQMLLRGGVIVDLFRVAYRLAGHRRFPLALATVVSGGLLGAVSGSGAATSAALATLASPQLVQIGYSRRMSVAVAAVAGSLSAIIPPSLIMIIYGSLTSVSIGHLFIGALLPAGLCIGVYIGCLALFGEVEPGMVDGRTGDGAADDGDNAGGSVPAFVFVVVLMVVVFGGIYGGVVRAAAVWLACSNAASARTRHSRTAASPAWVSRSNLSASDSRVSPAASLSAKPARSARSRRSSAWSPWAAWMSAASPTL
ncbi:MAG TPA: TRAP transporter large permease subunit [Acidobacteria bacterium]|nr:TRAP transporter large permease subunit [Acidobacteriota bacterium]